MKRISSTDEKEFDLEMKMFYFSKTQWKENEKKIISTNPQKLTKLLPEVDPDFELGILFINGITSSLTSIAIFTNSAMDW